ncbi:MAG: Ras GTPase activating protein ira2 [Caeruleum heppii]|nr:MAG: Ras GTPase activating protein ira2 [Caeruleum heppii]
MRGGSKLLPHQTGTTLSDLQRDEALLLSRATLVELAQSAIGTVFSGFIHLLHDLSTGFAPLQSRPEHAQASELFVVELLADCCVAHWDAIRRIHAEGQDGHKLADGERAPSRSRLAPSQNGHSPRQVHTPSSQGQISHSGLTSQNNHGLVPPSLAPSLVTQAIEVLTRLNLPVLDSHETLVARLRDADVRPSSSNTRDIRDESGRKDKMTRSERVDGAVSQILEYLSASNWSLTFNFIQARLRTLRASPLDSGSGHPSTPEGLSAADTVALSGLQVMASLWVNQRKLSVLVQELCGCFLNLQKPAQSAVAIFLPETIRRWIDHNPIEFIHLHTAEKRLDGGADFLFDMSGSMVDDVRQKEFVWPLQAALLALIPEVFWVAGNMKEPKNGSVAKKAAFLEGLRKSLRSSRSRNTAAFCLISLCRVAQHFPADNDSALISYVLDVQNEVREEVFKTADESPIELQLVVAAFVSACRLDLDWVVTQLIPRCFESASSLQNRIAAIEACAVLARQGAAEDYRPLFVAIGPHCRAAILWLYSNHRDFPRGPVTGQPSFLDQLDADEQSYVLVCTVLDFMTLCPTCVYEGAPTDPVKYDAYFREGVTAFVAFLASDDEVTRTLAAKIARNTVAESAEIWMGRTRDAGTDQFLLHQWWSSTWVSPHLDLESPPANPNRSLMVSTLANKVLDIRFGHSEVKVLIHSLHDYLDARNKVLRTQMEVRITLDVGTEIPERSNASTDAEVAFLVLLCSADLDVCATTRRSLSLLCDEGSLTENLADLAHSPLSMMRNLDAYSDLLAPDFRLTGLVAFQKRYRRALARMSRPTAGLLTAWESVFSRWSVTSRHILSTQSSARTELDEKSLMEWRNYSGFLAALGGSCIADTPQAAQVDDALITGLRWIDRLVADDDRQSLLDQFVAQCLQLLSCPLVRPREAIREVLSTELSPSLYPTLFSPLEAQLTGIFEDTGELPWAESRIIFVEQAAALLKAMVERFGEAQESLMFANFALLSLNMARYINGLKANSTTLRVKIKICQFCEAVTDKRETLKLGHDTRIRNQLMDIIVSWITGSPASRADDIGSALDQRGDNTLRLQRDLDRASLRAIVRLTHGLPLQPREAQSDADSSESKSALFHDYFDRLLSLLVHNAKGDDRRTDAVNATLHLDEGSSSSELAIMAMSNLLSANIDVGLKQSLSVGYHRDGSVRTAFLRVLCNILNQETEYERLSDSAISEKYTRLLDVGIFLDGDLNREDADMLQILLNDLGLTISLCDSCATGEVDEITVSLMNIFDSRGKGFDLIAGLIEHEVVNTENEAELLRRNCVTTKLLSAYAKWKGSAYLKSTLQPVLQRLIQSGGELDLELDPARTTSPEQLQRNALHLRHVTKVFIDDICKSTNKVPSAFRQICSIISNLVMKRFPDARYTAVGAFMFLRFFCPAIVAPEIEGLVASVPSKDMRRGLLLITKVVQNLANNVLFGAKEPYMYPLNDFLAQNIYRVTGFLREISMPPATTDSEPTLEPYDFGSCVTLHRFLYDHWDIVRQKAIVRQSRNDPDTRPEPQGPPANVPVDAVEALGGLISILGPPSTDISWNRPLISANSPPVYCRFQQFMLKSAGRNTDMGHSTNAIYDGGYSKDDLAIICIILRNIGFDEGNADVLLYRFLKTASKVWHRPFCILIDATCYNSLNEAQDGLFKKLDALSPSELTNNLSKIYVYNMNSAYRKCFRRVLRLTGKNVHSPLHPSNVEYHFIASLQELQTHFHLGPLQLPKDTISVVHDSRFIFQPVVRLSKTKGKIDVIIKVGGQFVQITTTRKQEIVPGARLTASVNDVFRLEDVDEASSSLQINDSNAFAIRTENGKIVMYFNSPRRSDILEAIKVAKTRRSKEAKPAKSFERLIRPVDVPGTMLNIALMNLASHERTLRLMAYNLLCSLSSAFRFAQSERFVTAKELNIPAHSVHIVVGISTQLAQSEPHLTFDFLTEFFLGWERLTDQQRPLNVLYMVPWLSNLGEHVLYPEGEDEKGRERVALIARKLIDIALHETTLRTCFQRSVWPIIAKDEMLLDVFLDELVKAALSTSFDDQEADIISSVAVCLGTVMVQGKTVARLRKVLTRSSLRPTRALAENAVWNEVCVLLRICVAASFDGRAQPYLLLPELFHIITMIANSGSYSTRLLVHNLLVNTVHSMCASFPLDEVRLRRLQTTLASLSDPKARLLFTLHPMAMEETPSLQEHNELDSGSFSSLQAVVYLLLEIMTCGAPTNDIANKWRSRWMSLVASTAFQSNPAIQARAFAVMGCLASEEVDDDLLYQVLVSLRTAVRRFGEDGDSGLLIAIVTTLTKMMAHLPWTSRYVLQLFWVAIYLVRLAPASMFDCAGSLCEAVLQTLAASGDLRDGKMVDVLLEGRSLVSQAAQELDHVYGIRFEHDNFHFAVCASLVKGLNEPATESTAVRVLKRCLETTGASAARDQPLLKGVAVLPYLGLVAARAGTVDESREILNLSGMSLPKHIRTPGDVFLMMDIEEIRDEELLLNVAITLLDFASHADSVKERKLTFLHQVAVERAGVLMQMHEPVVSILDGVLLSSETPSTLEAAHALTQAMAADARFAEQVSSVSSRMLKDTLEEVGLSGIWQSSTFDGTSGFQKRGAVLVDRLIEVWRDPLGS